jgi:hypothetical protein
MRNDYILYNGNHKNQEKGFVEEAGLQDLLIVYLKYHTLFEREAAEFESILEDWK